MQELNQSWKGSHVCWLEGSHVSSYLFERRAFAHMAKLSAERVQEYLEKHPECFKKTQQSLPLRNENPWKNRETDLGVFLEKSFPR